MKASMIAFLILLIFAVVGALVVAAIVVQSFEGVRP